MRAGNDSLKEVREKFEALIGQLTGDTAHTTLLDEAAVLREALGNEKKEAGFSAVNEQLTALKADTESADRAPTPAQQQVLAHYSHVLEQARSEWRAQRAGALAQLNAHLRSANLPAIDASGGD